MPTAALGRLVALVVPLLGPLTLLLSTSQQDLAVWTVAPWLMTAAAVRLRQLHHTGWSLVAALGSLAGVLASPMETRSLALLSVVGVVAAHDALEERSLSGWLPDRAAGVARLPMALVVAAQITSHQGHTVAALALLGVSIGLTETYRWRPSVGSRLDGGLVRAVSGLTRVVAMILVLAAALPTLYLPGAVLNVWDRLRPRRHGRSNWQAREATREEVRRDQRRPFATTGATIRRRRLRTGGVVVAVTALAGTVAAVVGLTGGDGSTPRPIEFSDFAFPDEPWVDELFEANFSVTFHPALGWQTTEVTSPHLVVRDGVRRSWTPDDTEVVVWFLGGSAMWGLGQRDDHTIASEIARLSADTDRPIRAVNLAVPGYNQWQEVALMGFRLSRGERPDLIVFYDGANDMTSMIYRAGEGMRSLDEPPNRFHETIEEDTRYPPEPRNDHPADEQELVDAFGTVYGAGVDLARRTADAYDITTAFYWQPQYLSTRPSSVDEPLLELFPLLRTGPGDYERRVIDTVRRDLPTGVIDLGGALDNAGVPTWYDPVHTNEVGAALVASDMWSTLERTVGDLP